MATFTFAMMPCEDFYTQPRRAHTRSRCNTTVPMRAFSRTDGNCRRHSLLKSSPPAGRGFDRASPLQNSSNTTTETSCSTAREGREEVLLDTPPLLRHILFFFFFCMSCYYLNTQLLSEDFILLSKVMRWVVFVLIS